MTCSDVISDGLVVTHCHHSPIGSVQVHYLSVNTVTVSVNSLKDMSLFDTTIHVKLWRSGFSHCINVQ